MPSVFLSVPTLKHSMLPSVRHLKLSIWGLAVVMSWISVLDDLFSRIIRENVTKKLIENEGTAPKPISLIIAHLNSR